MHVLIACEFSGIVRDAFLARGHDAISCDLLPSERPGPHIQGDVKPLLRKRWDLIIAHPPCTYLCNSGVRWLRSQPERWKKMRKAARFFMLFFDAKSERIAIENPTMHGHVQIRKPDFAIQPWQFGHGETKRTCFWTRGLPTLEPTNIKEERVQRVAKLPPSQHRWRDRSRTYQGIADAMADQWGTK